MSITCLADGRAHDVPDTELAATGSRSNGHYLALCGHMVTAAPLAEPDGAPCRLCAET